MKTLIVLAALFFTLRAEAQIPGIVPADIYLPLEERGFKAKKIHSKELGFTVVSTATFQSAEHNVTTSGKNTSSVKSISLTTMVQPGKDVAPIALQIFGYIATLPYEGSDPKAAKKWVEENISNEGASTVIGGVKFEVIKAGPLIRFMTISAE
jgi:hypothetical protein